MSKTELDFKVETLFLKLLMNFIYILCVVINIFLWHLLFKSILLRPIYIE